ncbi:MAG: hypothetical protein RL885_01050 [Planctomycetota bacterium]
MMSKVLRPTLCGIALVLLTAPFAIAQERVALRGTVERVNGAREYQLACSIVSLTAQFDLERFVDQHVELQGVNVGDAARPRILVQSINTTPASLEVNGSGRLGSVVTVTVRGIAGHPVAVFFAGTPGYQPIQGGAFLLGRILPAIATGVIPASGELPFRFMVPSNGRLIGQRFFAQAVLGGSSGGRFELSGPDCIDITQ